jgi:hypothetical protein
MSQNPQKKAQADRAAIKQHLTYQIRANALQGKPKTGAEIDKMIQLGQIDGACDAMLVWFVSYPEGGGVTGQGFSIDGRPETDDGLPVPMADGDRFKAWALLMSDLSASQTLDDPERYLLSQCVALLHSHIARRQAQQQDQNEQSTN